MAVVSLVLLQRNGIEGVGLVRTVRRSSRMSAMVSSAESVGLAQHTGKKSTVLETQVLLVSGIAFVIMVVVESRTDVKTACAVFGPTGTFVSAIMDNDLAASRSHRCFQKIEGSVELGVGGNARIDARRSGQVEGDDGLR